MIDCFASKNSFWIDPQGHIRPCARYKEKTIHITKFNSYSEITDSEPYQQIRQQLNNDVWPKGCFRCKEDEEHGVHSKRQFYTDIGLSSPDDFMIDISMGNFCNLKCRMCGPHNSTLWISDYKHLVANGIYNGPKMDFDPYQLSDRDIDLLTRHIESVRGRVFIELKGGEPLIMPQTKQLVDRLIKLKNANMITMLIVTNGTVIPDWIKDVNQHFAKLQLVVSIDGIGDVYNYIRGNDKFSYDQCMQNILTYSQLSNIDLRFNVVVQNLNIHQMLDIHKTLDKFNTEVNYIVLSMPKFLAVNVMPNSAKKEIYDRFQDNKSQFGKYESLMSNIHEMMLTDSSDYDTFVSIMTELDKRRNQNIRQVLAHLV